MHARDLARVVLGPAAVAGLDLVANTHGAATAPLIICIHALDEVLSNTSLLFAVIVVDVEGAVAAVSTDLPRIVLGPAAISRFDFGPLAKTAAAAAPARARASAAAPRCLDEILSHTSLLLAIVIVDVERAVAAVARDLPRVKLGPAAVSRFDLGAFTEAASAGARVTAHCLNVLLNHPRFLLAIIIVDVEGTVASIARDLARVVF